MLRGVLWAMVVAWAGLIFYLSTGTFGGAFTAMLLGKILSFLHVQLSPIAFNEAHFLFRKAGHTTEYSIFAMLLYCAGAGEMEVRWQPRRALVSIVIAGIYSLTDEFHQRFVPGRGPSLRDCGLDTLAAAFGMLILYADARLFGRRKRESLPPGDPPS